MKEKEIGCMGWAIQRDEHGNNVSNCISPKLLWGGKGVRKGKINIQIQEFYILFKISAVKKLQW